MDWGVVIEAAQLVELDGGGGLAQFLQASVIRSRVFAKNVRGALYAGDAWQHTVQHHLLDSGSQTFLRES